MQMPKMRNMLAAKSTIEARFLSNTRCRIRFFFSFATSATGSLVKTKNRPVANWKNALRRPHQSDLCNPQRRVRCLLNKPRIARARLNSYATTAGCTALKHWTRLARTLTLGRIVTSSPRQFRMTRSLMSRLVLAIAVAASCCARLSCRKPCTILSLRLSGCGICACVCVCV